MEPITTAAAVSQALDSEAAKVGSHLFERLLGPAADEIGAALGVYTRARIHNVNRIVEKADRKSLDIAGSIHPRVAHRILEEGSFIDDEVMVEYLSGVLAAARTTEGDDDSAVPMSAMVTALSSAQIRLHFLLYRTWVDRLAELPHLIPSGEGDRRRITLETDYADLRESLDFSDDDRAQQRLIHAISGLVRNNLVGGDWSIQPLSEEEAQAEETRGWGGFVKLAPTLPGFELYSWALGQPFQNVITVRELAALTLSEDLPAALSRTRFPLAGI